MAVAASSIWCTGLTMLPTKNRPLQMVNTKISAPTPSASSTCRVSASSTSERLVSMRMAAASSQA